MADSKLISRDANMDIPAGLFIGYMQGYKDEKVLPSLETFSCIYGARWKEAARLFNSGGV